MARSNYKINYLSPSIIKKKMKNKLANQIITIWERESVIPNFLIGYIANVHNGKEFKPVKITTEKIGYKFGEFAATKKPNIYKGKKKVIKKK